LKEDIQVSNRRLGVVVHAYNPSYLGWRSGGSWFEANLGKNLAIPLINK
jgi:hypothetical protein